MHTNTGLGKETAKEQVCRKQAAILRHLSHELSKEPRSRLTWLWARAGSHTSGSGPEQGLTSFSDHGLQARNKKDSGQSCEMQPLAFLEPAQPLERSGPLPTAEKD